MKHFDLGDEINKKILNDSKERENFLKEWKFKIAQKLKINEDKLIFTDVHSGSLAVHAAIIDPTPEEEKDMQIMSIITDVMNLQEMQ